MKLNSTEKKIISTVYLLRALSHEQVLKLMESYSSGYIKKVMKHLMAENLVEKTGWKYEDCYYTLTNKAINILKKDGIINLNNRWELPDDFKTAAKLSFKPIYASHQLALNSFILEFISKYNGEFVYYDEKHMSKLIKNIRPDGVLLINGIYYFLEMDMNTEREQRLQKKWQSYRSFLTSHEYGSIPGKIRVLFILEGGGADARKIALWRMICSNLGDMISDKFDIVVQKKELLYEYILSGRKPVPEVLRKMHGFYAAPGKFREGILSEYLFDGYCIKKRNGEVLYKNGVRLEFIADDFTYENLYTIMKVKYFPKISAVTKMEAGEPVNYLVITDNGDNLVRFMERIPDGVFIKGREELSAI